MAAGTPVTFTVGVGAAPAIIRDVTIDFGDGSRSSLGALSASTPVQHVYTEEGTYRASATATDSSGFTETVATFVTILPQQPPSVIIQPQPANPVPGQTVIFTASRVGRDLDDSALRVDVSRAVTRRRQRPPATERRRRSGNRHEGHHRESRPVVRSGW